MINVYLGNLNANVLSFHSSLHGFTISYNTFSMVANRYSTMMYMSEDIRELMNEDTFYDVPFQGSFTQKILL